MDPIDDSDRGEDHASQIYNVYRVQIEHEDELIGLRVGWFVAAEAFLFAAYGVVLAVQKDSVIRGTIPVDKRVLTMVPLIGIVMAAIVGAAIGAAMHQMERLNQDYNGCEGGHPDQTLPSGYPPLRASDRVVTLGHLPAAFLAPIVIVAWFYVWKGYPGWLWSLAIVLILSGVFYKVSSMALTDNEKDGVSPD